MTDLPARKHRFIAWGASVGLHLVLLLFLVWLVPTWDKGEAAAPPLRVRIGPSQPPPPSAPPQPRVEQTAPQRSPNTDQSQPQAPLLQDSPAPRPVERPPEPPVGTQPSAAPLADQSPPATPETPAAPAPTKPAFDLGGLEDIQVADTAPSTRVSRQELADNLGELELEGTFTELRANPPRPQLRQFQNAYGTVVIHFQVRDGLLRLQSIEFRDGAVVSLPEPEKERLRNELRNWLRAWSLLGARDGSVGKITLRLVPSGS